MEKFVGSWEMLPEKTENAEAFWDKTNLPEEERKMRRELIPIVKFTLNGSGDTLMAAFTPKGGPKPLLEMGIKLGEPVETSFDGTNNTMLYEMKNGRFYEKHKAVKGDLVREYDAEAYIEGDSMIRIYSKGGVSMKNVYKKI